MNRYQVGLLVAVVVIVVAALFAAGQSRSPSSSRPAAVAAAGAADPDLLPAGRRPTAPEFTGLAGWLNTPPLTLASLRGQVVLVDFWTYSCVNCVRTIPHLRLLNAAYGGRGLTIVGMHSPEFDFERSQPNVAAAVKRLDVSWPVGLDSNLATWNAYSNQYWPAEYLVDQQGRVAYFHAGEGEYDRTERAIGSLLGENVPVAPGAAPSGDPDQTPELYAGSARAQPGRIELAGPWADHGDYAEATGAARIQLRFHAAEVYLVAESATGQPLSAAVTLDGQPVADGRRGPDLGAGGTLTVGRSDLFHVLTRSGGDDHTIAVDVPKGFRLYTFTFG